jgi:hypothetical protein
MEPGPDVQKCYALRGQGFGSSFFLSGDVDSTTYGSSGSCHWDGGEYAYKGCTTVDADGNGQEDYVPAFPHTTACGYTKTTSVSWVVLSAIAWTDCE